MTKVITDERNGGLRLKDTKPEMARKWLNPLFMALAIFILKGILSEMVNVRDSTRDNTKELVSMNDKLNDLAVRVSEHTVRLAKLEIKKEK